MVGMLQRPLFISIIIILSSCSSSTLKSSVVHSFTINPYPISYRHHRQTSSLFFDSYNILPSKHLDSNIQQYPVSSHHLGTITNIATKMMMLKTKDDEDVVVHSIPNHNQRQHIQTSLVSSHVIYMENDTQRQQWTWTLLPLERVVSDVKGVLGVGTTAIQSLKSSMPTIETMEKYGHTKFVGSFDERNQDIKVQIIINNQNNDTHNGDRDGDGDGNDKIENANNDLLIATISRIMIQQMIRDLYSSSEITSTSTSDSNSTSDSDINTTRNNNLQSINVNLSSSYNTFTKESYDISNLLSSNGYPPLFQSLLPPDTNMSKIEMSDMVDAEGIVIGSLPRLLVHKLNILHRGIGIVVCNEEHITKNNTTHFGDLYCHQRTKTKRIFPSLYDMFVGGVSTAGESSILTAAREVAEELGLDRPLRILEESSHKESKNEMVENDNMMMTMESPLSKPLFKCTVCTSYNRCVVTVFTYKFEQEKDCNIKWQEEEVSWGDFVPYHIVEYAAALSIQRLVQNGLWPGSGNDNGANRDDDCDSDTNTIIQSNIMKNANLHFEYESQAEENWNSWDFVPDGLLVWIAWLKWLNDK
mmetsp:Transcript_28927/g.33621  ORF Transcript_28927/g.33621 Transcript_28927/m.33621 type:complete len:586 (+) Transcript_28927:121-1878(+)